VTEEIYDRRERLKRHCSWQSSLQRSDETATAVQHCCEETLPTTSSSSTFLLI